MVAELSNKESAEAATVKFSAKEQPEVTNDAASNVDIVYTTLGVSEERVIIDVTSVVVKGDFDELLVDKDCKSIERAFILFKTEDKKEWSKQELDTTQDSFVQTLYLPDYCKKYLFQLNFEGFPGTESISLELETTIGPAHIEETGLEKVPVIQELQVVAGVDKAVVEWRQPDCVPSYQVIVLPLDDCGENEKFEDCFESAPDATDEDTFTPGEILTGQIISGDKFKEKIVNLESCREYVVMARTTNDHGKGDIVRKLFRTRKTDPGDEYIANLAIDDEKYSMVTNLRVEPGMNHVKIFWDQPECFPSYEVQVMKADDCKDSYDSCLDDSYTGDTEEITNMREVGGLEECTEYVAVVRNKGRRR